MNDTRFFNGVSHPLAMKNFEIRNSRFEINVEPEILNFTNLEHFCFHSLANIHFHPDLSRFPNIKSFGKHLGNHNFTQAEKFNY